MPAQDHVAQRLIAAGMGEPQASAKATLVGRSLEALRELGVDPASAGSIFVPGRIEFLGKHTDYGGGRSLVCTVERGIVLTFVPRGDSTIRIVLPSDHRRGIFELHAGLRPTEGRWTNYPMTVARRVARNFPGATRGCDLAIAADLPQAAGLSSSSALIVGMFLVLSQVNGLAEREEYQSNIRNPEELAGYLGTVENGQSFGSLAGDRGVGTFGGSQDHTAILCCRPRHLSRYSFCPVRAEGTAALPSDHVLAVACSGVVAEKTGDAKEKYNRASRLTGEVLRLWRDATCRADATLADAIRSSPDAPHRLRSILRATRDAAFDPDSMIRRLEQFAAESERIIPAVAAALRDGRLSEVGELVDESQRLAEQGLQNQVPQTVGLARLAREAGATAASAFGAGFGGSVWALVRRDGAEDFADRWMTRYRAAFPAQGNRAGCFLTEAGPAVTPL